ncbi:MAG: MFS transporter [Kiritimatiellales bacterium]|nr:MFS transporter [Kiritimatiellales bacterium]
MNQSCVEKDGKWFDGNGVQVWRAGTLVYYKKDLFRMFFWLYIGQFTFWMENIAFPTLFPLLLVRKGFSAVQIGSLWSIYPLGALIVFPIIGTLSDRTRTRWGRRRPYDLLTTPIWFVGLLLLPFITTYWQAFFAMVLVGVAGAGSNVLIGFYNDVVPPELMGRFSAGMRMLGSFGALFVQLVALRLFDSAPIVVFLVISSLGFIGEMLMLFNVKEGEYPPPPPKVSILKTVGGFLKEGFANRYIVFLWLTMGVTALGGPVMMTYFNLFFTDVHTGLGLSSTQLGYILAAGTVIGLCLILPAGWVIDRIGPKKIWGWCGFFVGLLQLLMFVFARSMMSVAALYALFAALNTMLTAALLPMMYSFIPKDKFGQLNGANQLMTRILQIIGANACGLLIAAVHQQYRFAFLFGGVAYMLTPLFLYLMLRQPYPYDGLETSMHPDGRAGKKG